LFGTLSGFPPDIGRGSVGWTETEFAERLRLNSDREATWNSRTQRYESKLEMLGAVRLDDHHGRLESAAFDLEGHYSFPAIHPGKWELTLSLARCWPLRMDLDLSADEPEHRLDLLLQSKEHIDVRVIPRAAPSSSTVAAGDEGVRTLFSFELVATREPPGALLDLPQIRSMQQTRFGLSFGPAGETRAGAIVRDPQKPYMLVLDDPLPLYVSLSSRGVVLETKLAPIGTDELTFTVGPEQLDAIVASIHLRIVEREGGAVPSDCSVELNVDPMTDRYHGGKISWRTAPDTSGDVSFPDVAAGSLQLVIRAEGHESITQWVIAKPGELVDLGTIELTRFGKITARVLDAEGRPVSVLLNAFPLDQFESTRTELSKRFFKSNEDGELTVPSVGRGRYLLRVVDETWGAMPLVIDTTRGEVKDVEIRVKPKVEVTLRFARGTSAASRFAVVTSDKLPVLELDNFSQSEQKLRLVPGIYALRLTAGDEVLLHSAFFVDTKSTVLEISGGK
jgi:hypothetical protein